MALISSYLNVDTRSSQILGDYGIGTGVASLIVIDQSTSHRCAAAITGMYWVLRAHSPVPKGL